MVFYMRNERYVLSVNRAYTLILKDITEMYAIFFFKTLKGPNLLLVKFTKTNNSPPPTQRNLQNNAVLILLQDEAESQFIISSKRIFRRKSMWSRYHRLQTQIFYTYEFYHGSCLCFQSHHSS